MLEKIKRIVEQESGVNDIAITKRQREYVLLRQIYAKIARELTLESLHRIAKPLGKDHATIIHYISNFEDYLKYHNDFKVLYHKCYAKALKAKEESSKEYYIYTNLGKLNNNEINQVYELIRTK